ncbi:MAG: GTPase Der [Legionellaceae bacterium]
MLPVIALIGRPNVGKSTLFNVLTKSREALVADLPGLTRDRLYGRGEYDNRAFIVIDTGGLTDDAEGVEDLMAEQTLTAINEADKIVFLVDARAGLTPADEQIAKQLRRTGKNIHVVVNKIDGIQHDFPLNDFNRLGLGLPIGIAASHHHNITDLLSLLLNDYPITENVESEKHESIKTAIIGRPNVGKSTLVNRLLGENRQVVFDAPGTTRDAVAIPLERRGKNYTLIDTAGVRRRSKIDNTVEKFSVVKTLQAISAANVVILVIDARIGITDQDLDLLGFIIEEGKGLIIAVNKWDGLSHDVKESIKKELHRRLTFANFALLHFISALHGTGVGDLFKSIDKVYASAMATLSTSILNRILEKALLDHQPPLVNGRRIKLRYAHAGGHNPPLIIVHGSQANSLPRAYQRYLANYFRQSLKLVGTPVNIGLKQTDNPYKDKKNILTPKQIKKRQRLMKFIKGKK